MRVKTLNKKPPVKQAAFSLMELVVVIMVIGILVAVVAPRFGSSDSFDSRAAAAELVSHLKFAQQLAMNNTSRSYRAVVSATQVDVQFDSGAGYSSIANYPVDFTQNYAAIFSAATFNYDSMGNSNSATISVSPSSGVSVCVEGSGYAWLC